MIPVFRRLGGARIHHRGPTPSWRNSESLCHDAGARQCKHGIGGMNGYRDREGSDNLKNFCQWMHAANEGDVNEMSRVEL